MDAGFTKSDLSGLTISEYRTVMQSLTADLHHSVCDKKAATRRLHILSNRCQLDFGQIAAIALKAIRLNGPQAILGRQTP
jgi:hypothetical protein